jgi:hypothetical protein
LAEQDLLQKEFSAFLASLGCLITCIPHVGHDLLIFLSSEAPWQLLLQYLFIFFLFSVFAFRHTTM